MTEEDYKECCVVGFANSKGNYVKGLERLHESLRNNFKGTFLGFIGEQSIGAPMHSEVPYGFKIYAIKAALDAGFKKIIYVDSSCFAIKDIEPCFEELNQTGFLFQESGYFASEYINDYSLNYFGITREQAREIKLVGNAGMIGLNFNMILPNEFFKKWEQSMLAGCFKGEWQNNKFTESKSEECKGHRHDMGSGIILHQLGVSELMKSGNTWLQYGGVFSETINNTIIWKAQGC